MKKLAATLFALDVATALPAPALADDPSEAPGAARAIRGANRVEEP